MRLKTVHWNKPHKRFHKRCKLNVRKWDVLKMSWIKMMRMMSAKSYSSKWTNYKMRKNSCSQRANKNKSLPRATTHLKNHNLYHKTNKNLTFLKGSKISTTGRSRRIMTERQGKLMILIVVETFFSSKAKDKYLSCKENYKKNIFTLCFFMCRWRWMSFLSFLVLFSTFLGPCFMSFCHQEAVCIRKDVLWLLNKLSLLFHFSIIFIAFASCFQEEKIKSDWLKFRVIFLFW